MIVCIVIPVHNEEEFLPKCLESLVSQNRQPDELILVDDNSTDNSGEILDQYSEQYDWIKAIHIQSSSDHLPGGKVIKAFQSGLKEVQSNFDIICKYDADIVFPENYIESIVGLFEADPKLGICGGLPYIKVNGEWKFENIASRDHVRGPVKAYRKTCFEDIGGLKAAVGWDTLDVLLAEYHGWNVYTAKNLPVKHLKPTGKSYRKSARLLQGEAMYRMRYGLILSCIALGKGAFHRKQGAFLFNGIRGYFQASSNKPEYLVTEEEGRFIRDRRWKNIWKKLNPFRRRN
ncbi:MAG: glycosyltransferase family 2 protein [Flavobacteriaceae bacterium]|nr:glycosyltransferase family 2 protein [Flavobacteriaceae bacterium]